MRRIFTGFAVAALAAVVPTLALAGNQEMADHIAQKLRNHGQMSGYKIGIKCQDGTAWLRGHVTSEKQMNTALKLAFQTQGVTRVVNQLALGESTSAPQTSRQASHAGHNPLRGHSARPAAQKNTPRPQKNSFVKRLESVISRSPGREHSAQADRVANSYRSAPVTRVSAEEPQEPMPRQMRMPMQARPMQGRPMPANYMAMQQPGASNGRPLPMYTAAANRATVAPARYDQPSMPNYAWPSYASYPNYAAVTYPKQYSPTAWPYIGPFYPYPQVPMGWRKVTLEWDDGWWFLDFKDQPASCWHR